MLKKAKRDDAVTARSAFEEQFRAQAEFVGLAPMVISDGPLNADVAIIGEGPGESEVRSGVPFSGGSGALLWNTLRPYGLNRANVYVTNVCKRQVSLSRTGNERNHIGREEIDQWTGLLHWELSQLPNVRRVLLLGNYALEALLGHHGITNWRGSVLDCKLPNNNVGKAVITINPAYAMREPKLEPIFTMDCRKLDMVIGGRWKEYKIETLINPSYQEAIKAIADIKKAKLPTSGDIELINMTTACVGLANDNYHSVCINFRDATQNRYTLQEEADIWLALQDLCDSHKRNGVPMIGQNSQFDWYWTWLNDGLSWHFSDDTLLQHHTLYPQLPHSLAFLCSVYTTHPFYKDEGKTWKEGGDIDQFWRYNGKDSCITRSCWGSMERELKNQNLHDFYHNHVMRATPHLVQATVHGIKVDLDRKRDIVEAVSTEVQQIKQKFWSVVHELTDDDEYFPNPGSWQQMQELYFRRLKLRGRGTSTDEDNRKHIMKNAATPLLAKEMISLVDKYQKEAKFLGTYAESKAGEDGRFRCEYKQYGVQRAPGRLSSAELLDGWQGGNMQNQPERAKEMYQSDDGTVFFYFDLSQAEARVVGWRAGILKWIEQFEKARKDGKYDCHRALASDMFKIEYDKVPTDDWDRTNPEQPKPTIRWIAKRCRHGLNYRMERFRLSEVTGLPYYEANKNFIIYHRTTPDLMPWWAEEERLFRSKREVFNALGRRHKVIQRLDEDALGSIVAFYPQSTIGDKITQVWYQSEEDDKWPSDARICIDVHDNLIGMASPRTWKTALSICIKNAEKPIMIQPTMWDGERAHNKKPIPLIVPAEGKVSYGVRPVLEKKTGRIKYNPDPKGEHRWAFMEKVKL